MAESDLSGVQWGLASMSGQLHKNGFGPLGGIRLAIDLYRAHTYATDIKTGTLEVKANERLLKAVVESLEDACSLLHFTDITEQPTTKKIREAHALIHKARALIESSMQKCGRARK